MSQQIPLNFGTSRIASPSETAGDWRPISLRFNGSDYDPAKDDARLTGQIKRVFGVMRDGTWRTLSEIEALTGDPQASISAQLRHLRKPRFGMFTVERRRKSNGTWEYQIR